MRRSQTTHISESSSSRKNHKKKDTFNSANVLVSIDPQFLDIRSKLLREKAFFSIETERTKKNEESSFQQIQSIIFSNRNIFSLHLSFVQQIQSKNSTSYVDINSIKNKFDENFSRNLQKFFLNCITESFQNPSKFAKEIESFLSNQPNSEDYLIFSVFPALYSSFWSVEEFDRFFQFFQYLPPNLQLSFSRILIVHPFFHVFLSSFHDLVTKESNLKDILELFDSRSLIFPSYLKKIFLHN